MSLEHPESTSRLRSERGQIAIFIALIFQVLFVFFAMIVNIGLIVHDKINLQNSVDLAAYYAAQRQAEILNAIAHENYKIRQAWKLLSWRIRVLGDLGYRQHPLGQEGGGLVSERPVYGSGRPPVVCINHTLWGTNQNLCHKDNLVIPPLPDDRASVAPWVITSIIAMAMTRDSADIASADCARTGPINFEIAVRWARAYRTQVAKSKEVIRAYAALLADPIDFKDVRGNTVKGGARKTLERNLTRSNFRALQEDISNNFRFFNSMGGMKREEWLNEVPIYPLILYSDFDDGGTAACTGSIKYINGNGRQGIPENWTRDTKEVDAFRNEPTSTTDLYHSVFGVEKNPWAMAYVGVYAETKPRKPYLPFGEPITLRAKAFAKPFGGRVGPWYYRRWPQGSNASVGNLEDRVDQLSPIALDPTGKPPVAGNVELQFGVPNFARFPGDKLGLSSISALTSLRSKIREFTNRKEFLKPGFYSGIPNGSDGLAYANTQAFADLNKPLPILGYAAPWIREIELAAIAPDIFDITYYSIDRDAYNNYTDQSIKGGIFTQDQAPMDIGSLDIQNNRKDMDAQFAVTKYVDTNAFWVVRSPQHLLTSWAPAGPYDYSFPSSVFARCGDEKTFQNVPGRCGRGGRVGYSVKIVSEEYLKSDKLPLGGMGEVGRLKNPPPAQF